VCDSYQFGPSRQSSDSFSHYTQVCRSILKICVCGPADMLRYFVIS